MWAFVVLLVIGQLAWIASVASAERWLVHHDPAFAPQPFVRRLVRSFLPIRRYHDLRIDRGESTALVSLFWGALATILFGLFGLLVSLAAR